MRLPKNDERLERRTSRRQQQIEVRPFRLQRRPRSTPRLFALLLLIGLLLPRGAGAAEFFVEMFSGAFLPQSLQVQAGDTVTWLWVAGDHQLMSGVPGGTPGTPDEPGAFFSATIDSQNLSFSYTFLGPAGTIAFHDANNPTQIGFVQVLGDELTFDVAVLDNVFEPETVEVFEGDSIRWVHEPMEMPHTVTSGLSSNPANNPGALFDEISSDQDPIFVYTFDDPGDFPYFCIPHEFLDMVGLIRVQDRFIRGDANRDGTVEIADPITVLGVLFQGMAPSNCPDASDANDDGSVDVGDVIWTLAYLFSGGAPPSSPFPAEGPDRTEDALLCFP